MMNVVLERSGKITEICEKDRAVFFRSEAGTLRITPMQGGIVRVSFSCENEFDQSQGKDFASLPAIPADITDRGDEIEINTGEGAVIVSKETGSVAFFDHSGNELLRERNSMPRHMESITLYRTADARNIQVEEIVTADGVKKRLKSADREEYGYAYKTRTYFEFGEDEQLLGFGQGEKGEWNLRKRTYYVHQANRKIGIPMVLSDRKYGILLSTQSLCLFSENEDEAFIQTEADRFSDYYFLYGKDLFSVVQNYRRLTGKAAMLPKWAFGYIQSKERYESGKEILEAAEGFAKRNIPIDCLVLDWMSWKDGEWGQKSFDKTRFPNPEKMTDELHKRGIRFMISVWPTMSPGTENNEEFKSRGLLLPGTDIYNAFSKEAGELYWSQAERGLYRAGVDAWWCDSSEPLTPEWEHSLEPTDGEKYYEYRRCASDIMPLELANAYGRYHAENIWNGQRNQTKNKRVVNLTRSGWAGSQKYGTVLWSGDISASWKCLENQVKAGLQMAVSGMPYWTLDTGAFFVKKGIQWYWNGEYKEGIDEAYKKLYVRWLEFSAFLPVFRAHGTDVDREPWAFGEPGDRYYEAICTTIRNRYRLIPYLYSLGAQVCLNDAMMIRPLLFDFCEDRRVYAVTDQYMLGDSLMICPVVGPEDERTVYFPKGTGWYDYNTNRYYEGGTSTVYDCPLDRIPVFVKAGSLIPIAEPASCTDSMNGKPVEVVVYPGRDAAFKLYEDAGDGYGYEEGEYNITELRWNDDEKFFSCSSSGDIRFRNAKISYRVI